MLSQTYSIAKSSQDFYDRLANQNLNLYSRWGKLVGIQGKRKYRFRTLGYNEELIQQLDLAKDMQQDISRKRLQKLQRKRNRGKSRDQGLGF